VLQEERALRNNKNYETLDTNKSGVRFRSPALADLNSEYVRARDHYAEQQKAIVTEIVNIAGEGYTVSLEICITRVYRCKLFQFLCLRSTVISSNQDFAWIVWMVLLYVSIHD
jgi:DNA mismatch repair protein MSH2